MGGGEADDNARMLMRTIRLSFDGSGRSRRTEVVYWYIATALVGTTFTFAATTALPWKAGLVVGDLLQAILFIPGFALFARRLHDQDRSGWWALLLLLPIALSLPDHIRMLALEPADWLAAERQPDATIWAAMLAGLIILVLLLLPGTVGPNRFGDDPRQAAAD
ncbi:DUF805 domain-containing protein [Sphingomonas sp. YL-JM2C]